MNPETTTLNKHKSYLQSKIVSLILTISFFLILFPNHSIGQTSEKPISFEKFVSSFDLTQQTQSQKIWTKIATENQDKYSEFVSPSVETISDSVLFADISSDRKDEHLKQLKVKRLNLNKLKNELAELKLKSANWDQFVSTVENIPELGSMYLKSVSPQKNIKNLVSQKESQVTKLQKEITDIRVNASLSEISLSFTIQDWITIVIYLILTTILGGLLAGKQSSMKDFFLGGRKLPWTAVCGSIIATELSAATFLIAPAIVFSKGGDMTYIQLALGTIIARFVIGYFFIPA